MEHLEMAPPRREENFLVLLQHMERWIFEDFQHYFQDP